MRWVIPGDVRPAASRAGGDAPADVLELAEACGDTVLGVARKVLELLERDGGRSALHVASDLLSGAFLAGDGVLQAGRERPDPDPRLTGPQWAEEVRRRSDADVRAATLSAGAA